MEMYHRIMLSTEFYKGLRDTYREMDTKFQEKIQLLSKHRQSADQHNLWKKSRAKEKTGILFSWFGSKKNKAETEMRQQVNVAPRRGSIRKAYYGEAELSNENRRFIEGMVGQRKNNTRNDNFFHNPLYRRNFLTDRRRWKF